MSQALFKSGILSLLLLLSIASFFTNSANAQTQQPASDITVFPALYEIATEPGNTKNETLLIVNNSKQPLPVQLEVRSIISADEIIDLTKRSQFDASRWVKLETSNIALESGETRRLSLNISVPKNASAGGHYAEIVIKKLVLENDQSSNETNTVLVPQVKVPLLISVAGETKEELIIEADDMFPGFIGFFGTLNTNISIANTGTSHVLPAISIDVYKNGQLIKSEPTSPGLILPNTKKSFNLNWKPSLGVGFYELKVKASYGNDGNFVESKPEKAFVFFPFWGIITLFGVSIILGFLLAKRQNISKAVKVIVKGK